MRSIFLFLLLAAPLSAQDYTYRATVEKVIDGDTVDLKVDLGFHISFTDRFRLYGIDAWETTGEEKPRGIVARESLKSLLDRHKGQVVLKTLKDKRGKYGRWLAILEVEGLNVNDWLVEQGHAEKAYLD